MREHIPARGAERGPGGGAALVLPAAGQHVGIPGGSCVVRVPPAMCTPKEDTSRPPAMFAPHSTLRRLFSKEGLPFPLPLSSPNLAVPGVWLKCCFSKERRRVRSGFEMSTCPILGTSHSTPLQPRAQRAGLGGEQDQHRVAAAKRASEWEIFMSETCSRASLIMLFIFLSKSSH